MKLLTKHFNATIDSIKFKLINISYINEGCEVNINSTFDVENSNNQFDLNQLDDACCRLPKKIKEIIYDFNNSGFPFANLNITSADFDSNALNFKLRIDKGPLVKIDTLINLA